MSWWDRFWKLVCAHRDYLVHVIAVLMIMLALTGFALVFGTPGTAAYTLALLDAGLIVLVLLAVVGIFWQCGRRREEL